MPYPVNAPPAPQQVYCGPSLGEFSGGNWMTSGDPCSLCSGDPAVEDRTSDVLFLPPSELLCPYSVRGLPGAPNGQPASR
jgi:hypothetical protein